MTKILTEAVLQNVLAVNFAWFTATLAYALLAMLYAASACIRFLVYVKTLTEQRAAQAEGFILLSAAVLYAALTMVGHS